MTNPRETHMRIFQRGITLIELMTVLVIVAILASIGIPSYSQYVRRSHRAEAKAALLQNAQFMERNFTVSNSYSVDGAGDELNGDALPVTQTPKEAAKRRYRIVLDNDASSFTLSAIPEGANADDECGTLTLTNTGLKEATGDDVACWSK
jgi:type IV pilus assembly protein PilE